MIICHSSLHERVVRFSCTSDLILGAEADLIVDAVHIILHVLAGKCGAHIIEGIGVSTGTSLLQPPESWLNSVVPGRILVLASISIRESWHGDTFLLPISTATAS
jgi:hypothetical protein